MLIAISHVLHKLVTEQFTVYSRPKHSESLLVTTDHLIGGYTGKLTPTAQA